MIIDINSLIYTTTIGGLAKGGTASLNYVTAPTKKSDKYASRPERVKELGFATTVIGGGTSLTSSSVSNHFRNEARAEIYMNSLSDAELARLEYMLTPEDERATSNITLDNVTQNKIKRL